MSTPKRHSIAVDVAGARVGGAATYLRELERYLASTHDVPIRIIGKGRPFNPGWLAYREIAARSSETRIALNNVSFAFGADNVTLLGNALHFADERELIQLSYTPSPTLRVQGAIARKAAKRSRLLVAPCQAMADRVVAACPEVSDRVSVRAHPLSKAPWANGRVVENNDILLPVLNAPYKQLDFHAHKILDAMDSLCLPSQLIITSDPDTFPAQVRNHPRARFVGPLDHEHLQTYWAESRAIYFPTRLESFGYPLAEARVNGLPIIAPDTQQSREIAGPALKGYLATDPRSLVRAVEAALTETVLPDPEPFNPKKYFDWLLGVAP